MKNWWVLAGFFINGFFSGAAYADADFKLENRTGHTIRSVFVAPDSATNMGPDRLGQYVLHDRQSIMIRFPEDAECEQTLYLEFHDLNRQGQWEKLNKLNLCEWSKITMEYSENTGSLWGSKE